MMQSVLVIDDSPQIQKLVAVRLRPEGVYLIRMSAEEHNRAVTGYFLAAGLPREQMTAAAVTTLHQGTGSIDEVGVTSGDHGFMAYYSHVGRAIDGIPVVESTAWARLNDEGVVVSEEVR